MTEVLIGDKWIDLPDKAIEYITGIIDAEEKEKRIWRPLYTVIGTKDLLEVRNGLDRFTR